MKALKCDVCGGYFDSICTISEITDTSIPNKINIHFRTESERIKGYDYLDICPDCYRAVKKALDDRRKIIVDTNEDDLK